MQNSAHTSCNDAISCYPDVKDSYRRRVTRSSPARTLLIAALSAMAVSMSAFAVDIGGKTTVDVSPIKSNAIGGLPSMASKISLVTPVQGAVSTATVASLSFLLPIITVAPAVELPGRPRVITIAGQTYAGCPFATPSIDSAASQLLAGVVIRLDPVQTLAPCSINSFTPYRFELPYTPVEVGTLRIVAASSSGLIRSESRLATAAVAGRARALGDISGLWYDPASNGSGLQFTHNATGSDGVFGTWFLFDLDGKPRWLTIQGVVWRDDGATFTGDLFETRTSTIACSPACPFDGLFPRTASTTTKVGTVRFSFSGLAPYSDTVPQGNAEAFSLTGALLFKSAILRIPL
ncbi:MAG: hypothetical protein ABI583_09970 [Betaproteobacteria bacterium]